MNQTAYLSNRGEYTTFSVGDRTITFLTSKNLEKYIEVVEWDGLRTVRMDSMKVDSDCLVMTIRKASHI